MSGESLAQQIDAVRQRPQVLLQLAEQAGEKDLTPNPHELSTAIEKLRAASQSEVAIAISDTGTARSFDLAPKRRRARAHYDISRRYY